MTGAKTPKVKPISLVFDPHTVYGAREGHHSALLVVSHDKGNVFLRSQLWRSGVVTNISMLPRILAILKFCSLFCSMFFPFTPPVSEVCLIKE